MKEIKAYVNRSRIADVIAELKATRAWGSRRTDVHNLAVYVVKGSLLPVDSSEPRFSIELGDEVVNEYKVELLCEDGEVDEIVTALNSAGRTGQAIAGWITVTAIERVIAIH